MEDVALHILDIAQNSIEAGAASIEIDLLEDPVADTLAVEVRDDGPGMDEETLARAADPFFTTRTTRPVGMGLALLAQAARAAGGDLALESHPGRGSRVKATFRYHHFDRAPIGDIETTFLVLLAGHPDLNIRFCHRVGSESFELDSRDLRAAGIDPSTPGGLEALRRILRQGEGGLPTPALHPRVY